MTSISHFSDIPASASRTAGSVLARSLVPGELESNADRIRFSPIDLKRSFPPGATDETLLLGEFQLAFVIFLIGQVYDGFEQWKTMVQLVYLSNFLFERFNWVAVPRISTLDDSDSDDADLDGDGIPRADYRIRSTFACRNEGGVVDDIEDEEDDEYRPVIVYDVE
nr:hypothetical protein HK105_007022 [Polyrhizophydium stewartii]